MKCESCGAPVENNVCTYCGKKYISKSAQPVQPAQQIVKQTTVINNVQPKVVYVDKTKEKKKKKRKIILIIIAVLFFFGIIGSIVDSDTDTSLSDGIVVSESFIEKTDTITQKNVISALKKIEGVKDYQSVTKDNDPNDGLSKEDGYISATYFSYKGIDTSQIEGVDLVDKGNNVGGSIEIYRNEDDAKSRMNRLRNLSEMSGGSEQVGVIVIRTSLELTQEEHVELVNDIIKQLEIISK